MADFVEKEDEEQSTTEEVVLKDPESAVSENMDPVSVVYCPKCTLPPEYCEHGPCFEECLPWILKNFPQVLSDVMLAKMLGEVEVNEEEEKPKKKNKGPKLKKSVEVSIGKTQVVIAKVQRQKRKFITAVAGLDTVPGTLYRLGPSVSHDEAMSQSQQHTTLHFSVCTKYLFLYTTSAPQRGYIFFFFSSGLKLKDAAKAFGKKFSSGASINEGATGNKEVRKT